MDSADDTKTNPSTQQRTLGAGRRCCSLSIILVVGAMSFLVVFSRVPASGVEHMSSFLFTSPSRRTQSNDNKRPPRHLQDKCEDSSYLPETLKMVYELPFASLFANAKGQRRFDASSVVIVGDYAYTVYDRSHAIGKVAVPHFASFNQANVQISNPTRGQAVQSGYEAVFHNDESGHFFAVRESVEDEDGGFHAVFVELAMNGDETDYTIVETCPSEYEFNKELGISGAALLRSTDNDFFLLALCSANHCDDGDEVDRGNGRVIIMRYTTLNDGLCQWTTERIIDIPDSANFLNYSDLAVKADNGRVAITSSEESEVWIGQLLGQDASSGLWDISAIDFDNGDSYNFPRDNECTKIYCGIKGVQWLKGNMLLMVSDKMENTFGYECFDKDQSLHIFALPGK
jgi:hypothetical protein